MVKLFCKISGVASWSIANPSLQLAADKRRAQGLMRICLILTAVIATAPQSAAVVIDYDTNATFTGIGDFDLGSSPGQTVDFTDSINAISGGTSANLVNVGDMDSVSLGTISLVEADNFINCNPECGSPGLNISFTFSSVLMSFNAAAVTFIDGAITDPAVDISFNFTGLTSAISFGTTGVITVTIVDAFNSSDSAFAFTSNTGAGGTQEFFAQLEVTTADASTVPEPGTLGLFGLGLIGAAVVARRRRQ